MIISFESAVGNITENIYIFNTAETYKIHKVSLLFKLEDLYLDVSAIIYIYNPLMPSGAFNICCPRDAVSRTANEKLVTIVANGH